MKEVNNYGHNNIKSFLDNEIKSLKENKDNSNTIKEDNFLEIAKKIKANVVHKKQVQNITVKHDIKNATFEEFKEVCDQLLSQNQITNEEHAIITFSPKAAKVNMTEFDENNKLNWCEEFKARARKNIEKGTLKGYIFNRHISEILSKLYVEK
ncbi:hypothetical protein WG909_03970 [Peptostreptococcaceae bacterium AGR-M142]